MARLVLKGTHTANSQEEMPGLLDSINAIPGVFNVRVKGLVITFEVDRTQ